MSPKVQSVYDVEFGVYDVEFAVFEEATPQPEAVATLDATVHKMSALAIQETEAEPVNPAVIAELTTEVALLEPPTLAVVVSSSETPKEAVSISKEPIYLAPEFRERVTHALDTVLFSSSRPIVIQKQLLKQVYGRPSVEESQYELLVEAVAQDGRLEYFRNGAYIIKDRADEVEAAYMAGIDVLNDISTIPTIIEEVLTSVVTDEEGRIQHRNVMGTLYALGHQLTRQEANEFLAQLAMNPRVTAQTNGNFIIKDAKIRGSHEVLVEEPDETGPLTVGKINKALKEISASDDMRKAHDLAKRIGNPRKHGKNFRRKGSKMMGKNHNKTKTFEQMVAAMNAQDQAHPGSHR